MVDQVSFPPSIGGSGKIYTNDANPETGMYGGAHRKNFFPIQADMVAAAGYVSQYAQAIDGAKANADRAEDAKGYVEAVADQYQINILEQFRHKATFDLDFDRGIYRIDSGESVTSTNVSEILTVSRTTPKWVEGPDGLLREVPPNELAREWRNGKPLGIRAEGPRTNRLLRNETFDGIPWGLFSSASVQTEIGVGNPKSLNGDCVLFSSDGSGINNRIQQSVSGLTVGNVFSAGVYAKKKEGGAGGRFRMSVVSETETNLDANKTFEADDEWRFYPFSGVSSESDVNFMIRELDSACDIYIYRAMLVESGAVGSTIPTGASPVAVGGDFITSAMNAPVFSMTAGTFIIKARDFIKSAKTSHLFAFGGSIVPGRISIQSHRGRLFVLGSPYNITSLTNGLDGLAAITYNTKKREVRFSYNGATSTLSGLDFSSFNGDGGIGIGVYNTIQDGYDSSLSLISYCPRELTTLELNAITSQ